MENSIASAKSTAQSKLSAIWRMVAKRAKSFSFARSDFVPSSLHVARVTVVSVPMAEP